VIKERFVPLVRKLAVGLHAVVVAESGRATALVLVILLAGLQLIPR